MNELVAALHLALHLGRHCDLVDFIEDDLSHSRPRWRQLTQSGLTPGLLRATHCTSTGFCPALAKRAVPSLCWRSDRADVRAASRCGCREPSPSTLAASKGARRLPVRLTGSDIWEAFSRARHSPAFRWRGDGRASSDSLPGIAFLSTGAAPIYLWRERRAACSGDREVSFWRMFRAESGCGWRARRAAFRATGPQRPGTICPVRWWI